MYNFREMRRIFGVFLGSIVIAILIGVSWWETRGRNFAIDAVKISDSIREAGLDADRWAEISARTKKLPSIFPFFILKNSVAEIEAIFEEIEDLKVIFSGKKSSIFSGEMKIEDLRGIWTRGERILSKIKRIERNLRWMPDFLLESRQIEAKNRAIEQVVVARDAVSDFLKFDGIFEKFASEGGRILILFQNENEPRSTGGFVGTMAVADFGGGRVKWSFEDVYALDRLVPEGAKLEAPAFFHGLSRTISLRDANFWPDFPTSAEKIREFFSAIGEKVPDTIVAVNLELARELTRIFGAVRFEKWGLELDEWNADLGLEFLVESKIAGRWAVKSPVADFVGKLAARARAGDFDAEKLRNFDWRKFVAGGNLLVNSRDEKLQNLWEKWGLAGRVEVGRGDFLHLDFVSVGANKSEKFMWTKVEHFSKIRRDGVVENRLKIERTHALREGEIDEILGARNLPENVRSLLTDRVRWVLGEGENRTILRIFVPREAKLTGFENRSGEVRSKISADGKFRIFEVPSFVLPGEKWAGEVRYETKIARGSHSWRPYFLRISQTPGHGKTRFLKTISTEAGGEFSAISESVGRWGEFWGEDFRAVVEFDGKLSKIFGDGVERRNF